LLACWPAAGGAAPIAQTDVLLVSDIHFNPFDDPALVGDLTASPVARWHAIFATSTKAESPYFTDTNFALFESALAAMRRAAPDPRVVVISGDFLAHAFPQQFAREDIGAPPGTYETFVDKTIAFEAAEFDAIYPRAQFVVALGNNDGYCGDYRSTPNSPFLAHMASAWAPLVDRGGNAPEFAHDFATGGYYGATLPLEGGLRAIVVNSVFWSSLYVNSCGVAGGDPGNVELNWLAGVARSTSPADRTVLVGHMPPGIDEYSSLIANKPVPFLTQSYAERLLEILAAHDVRPAAFFVGHMHHSSFEIAESGAGQLPVLVIPSISPIQGNNPAFVVGVVDAAGSLADLTTYMLPLAPAQGTWTEEYTFDTAYGFSNFDARNLLQLQATLATDGHEREEFMKYYNSSSPMASPNVAAWPWLWCGHANLTASSYASCLGNHGLPRPASAQSP
jgi:hypothetical protein